MAKKKTEVPPKVKQYFELPPEVKEFFVKTGRIGGLKGGAKGGATAAANMTSEERKARATKASKAAAHVSVYTDEIGQLRRQTEGQRIHAAAAIEVWSIDPVFVGALVERMDRRTRLDVTRTDGALYVVVGGETLETTLARVSLAAER